jgi:hypothetical protein
MAVTAAVPLRTEFGKLKAGFFTLISLPVAESHHGLYIFQLRISRRRTAVG